MARTKGSHDIAPQIRGAFIRALKLREDEKKLSLSELIAKHLDEDLLGTLNAVSKFVPKEMLLEASITQQLEDYSDEALKHEIGRLVRESAPLLASLGTEGETEH